MLLRLMLPACRTIFISTTCDVHASVTRATTKIQQQKQQKKQSNKNINKCNISHRCLQYWQLILEASCWSAEEQSRISDKSKTTTTKSTYMQACIATRKNLVKRVSSDGNAAAKQRNNNNSTTKKKDVPLHQSKWLRCSNRYPLTKPAVGRKTLQNTKIVTNLVYLHVLNMNL